jgi:energy-converting hydrogenase Eha subunit E
MLVAGVLTCSGFYALVAPRAAVAGTYGDALDGAVADVIVRNWGALIGMVGVMLIYGAWRPAVRPLVLVAAGASKLVFITLVLMHGSRFLAQPVRVSIAVDFVMVALFAVHLIQARKGLAA